MRSRQLESALGEFFGAASTHLSAELAAGAEVPFELGSRIAGSARGRTPLYCFRALTGEFIGEREEALQRLPSYAEAARLLAEFDGLDRYLASVGAEPARVRGRGRARVALKALMDDVFRDQTDFELHPERLHAALERLEQSAHAGAGQLTLVGTLHGLTIASDELALTKGLAIAQPGALRGTPDALAACAEPGPEGQHLLVVHTAEEPQEGPGALPAAREVLKDLLRALRLFGDGRVTLGALAWGRIGAGPWNPLPLGTGGRPHGMLVITPEQEDELRAFCNLVSRRAPHRNELAWALRRFELGSERASFHEALTDHLLALRALLEPEGPSSGLLAGRVAALCATPQKRGELTERMIQAQALERTLISGGSVRQASAQRLAEEVADHLRALLRDVICGHLGPDLAVLADELLQKGDDGDGDGAAQEPLAAEPVAAGPA